MDTKNEIMRLKVQLGRLTSSNHLLGSIVAHLVEEKQRNDEVLVLFMNPNRTEEQTIDLAGKWQEITKASTLRRSKVMDDVKKLNKMLDELDPDKA